MTPPSYDLICQRPAGDEAGEKCGYVVQQINHCRWFGDQTYHLCNLNASSPTCARRAAEHRRSLTSGSQHDARWRRGRD